MSKKQGIDSIKIRYARKKEREIELLWLGVFNLPVISLIGKGLPATKKDKTKQNKTKT